MTKPSHPSSGLSPRYAVMGFLYLRPMHGYELHKHLAASLREVWRISQSQAYNILKKLEADGMVSVTPQPQEKRPDRELLALTSPGKAEFERWLRTPTPGSARALRVEFITRLFFASNLSEDLCLRLIEEQAAAVRASLSGLRARLAAAPADQIFNRMGLDLRIHQLEAVLGWIETCGQYFAKG